MRKVLLNKLSEYITYRVNILLEKYPFFLEKYPFLYRCVNNFFSAFNFLTDKVLSYIENTLKKETFINYTILYIYSEYLRIMEGKLSLNVFLIITGFVCNFHDGFQLYFILWSFSIFKYYLENNTWIMYNYPKLYNTLLELNSLIITGLILYFLGCMWIEVFRPLAKYLRHILKMESNNNNGNKYPESDLGQNTGENPNMEPNMEPNEPHMEPNEPNMEPNEPNEPNGPNGPSEPSAKTLKNRARLRKQRERKALQLGRIAKKYDKLDNLSPEEKKERAKQQRLEWRTRNWESISESRKAKYGLKRQARGFPYKPHEIYEETWEEEEEEEQTSQSVEEASQPVEEASTEYRGFTAVNRKR